MEKYEAQVIVSEAGSRLLKTGVIAGTWGNISQKINEEYFAITPSGKDYETLTASDIVIVNIKSLEYNGTLKPALEYKLHTELYKSRTDINAIIHTHSLYASIVGAARKEVPCMSTEMEKFIGDKIPVTKYAISGSKKLIQNTINAIGNKNAVILANHGAFCVGADMDTAFNICSIMEQACKDFIRSYEGVKQ